MVAAFIKKHGVTVCPAFGTPELAALNAERQRAYAEESRWNAGRRWRKPRSTTA